MTRESELFETNRRFYDELWADARLVQPDRFNTWPLVQSLVPAARERLEVAPGLRPRLPIAGSHFADISAPALAALHERGGIVALARITALPYRDAAFELLCALDVVEHVDDDDRALAGTRVTADGGSIVLSVPLHPTSWTAFDDLVGHRRRYEADQLPAKLARHGLTPVSSVAHGMQPRSPRLVSFGTRCLMQRRARAMWMYNRVLMPLALRLQKKLVFAPGMIDTANVDTILLVCRKERGRFPNPSFGDSNRSP